MLTDRVRRVAVGGLILLAAGVTAGAAQEPPHSAELDRMIVEQARKNGVPEKLVRRIVMRESKYDPRARNHLYWGLMQISYPTAKSMGFKGTPDQLLNPLVNLTYAVPYLANAFIIAGKREDEAVRLYAAGYYYTARQRGLLGLLRTAQSTPVIAEPDAPATFVASTDPAQGPYGALATPQPAAVASIAPEPAAVDAGVSDAHGPHVDVAMVADKGGEMKPPKKWLHDGGVSLVARGEQGLENVAAYAGPAGASDDKPSRHAHHAVRKTTEFASVDTTPQSAQAYAAQTQDARFAAAASQAAIAQATAGPPPVDPQEPQQAAAQQTAAPDPNAQPVAADADAPRKSRKSARHHHRHDETTEVAKSDAKPDGSEVAQAEPQEKPGRHRHHAKAKAEPKADVAAAQAADVAPPPPAEQH